MKINASVTDFPVFSLQETFFKNFKEAGVDGLEIVLGLKSRFEYARISYLSEKYALPITSIHQPSWSGFGILDESFIDVAKKLKVRNIVFHPLAFQTFESRIMRRYFEKLAVIQEKHNICVMLENMPKDFAYNKLHDATADHVSHHLEKINNIASTYGFMLTYDISHAEIISPVKNKTFERIFPNIANIHASSFTKHKHHVPLYMGEFAIEEFIQLLVKKKYKGLFTLEVYSPKLLLILNRYNFRAVKGSVDLLRKILGKLS